MTRLSKEREAEIRKWSISDKLMNEVFTELDECRAEFTRMENAWREKCKLAMFGETDRVVHPKLHQQIKDQRDVLLECLRAVIQSLKDLPQAVDDKLRSLMVGNFTYLVESYRSQVNGVFSKSELLPSRVEQRLKDAGISL